MCLQIEEELVEVRQEMDVYLKELTQCFRRNWTFPEILFISVIFEREWP